MKIPLVVTFINGDKTNVDAIFPDFIAFERERRKSVVKFEAEMQLTDLAWLAWHAEKRLNRTALKFDPDWVSTVEQVEARDEEVSVPLES